MDLAAEKYVRLTTFTKAGQPKHAPVWIADLGDGTVGFTTASSSWKIKRLGNDPRVELTPSDARGNPKAGAPTVSGTATFGPDEHFDRARAAISAKYGLQFRAIDLVGKLAKLVRRGSGTDTGVVVTLDDTPPTST